MFYVNNKECSMKKSMLSSLIAGLVASSGEVSALNTNYVSRALNSAPFSWEGFYAGIIGGGGRAHTNGTIPRNTLIPSAVTTSPNQTIVGPTITYTIVTDTTTLTSIIINPAYTVEVPGVAQVIPGFTIHDNVDFSSNDETWFLGGEIGYDYQYGPLLLGGVFDLSGSNINSTAYIGETSVVTDFDWFATARARVGIPINRLLIYGSGGMAWGNFDVNVINASLPFTNSFTKFGWSAGGGAAYAVQESWIVDASYLHLGFGTAALTGVLGNLTTNFSSDLWRIGLIHKFS
jgi:opacity protein-like surface antigen